MNGDVAMLGRNGVIERDACAIIAFVDKHGKSTHANIIKTIDALKKMGHRSGDINGEGDGCGILSDIPRKIWARRLEENGFSRYLAESGGFFVGHFIIPASIRSQESQIRERLQELFGERGAELVLTREGDLREEELGPRARAEAPYFWQVAGILPDMTRLDGNRLLFKMQMEIEELFPELHIASLSLDSVVYKLRGAPELLLRVFPELQDPDNTSVITLGHSRYSTNTLPTVERAQPFSMLGHNGEINTIEKLRTTSRIIGVEPVPGGSDSQDLNRIIEGLISLYGLDPVEALEMVFPAIHKEVEQYGPELQQMYDFYRWFFSASAQGPAALVARHGDVCMGSVDALGLRPLWFGESDYDYFLSSEKGVVDLEQTMSDPRPLAPGEKIAILSGRGRRAEVLDYDAFQARLLKLFQARKPLLDKVKWFHRPAKGKMGRPVDPFRTARPVKELTTKNLLGAFGWNQYDLNIRKRVATEGRLIVGSMGHQGPLAVMAKEALPNCSEYFKENVAVVTNPAIDREREAEHFTTRCILGNRPELDNSDGGAPIGLELRNPLLLNLGIEAEGLGPDELRDIADQYGTVLLEDMVGFFSSGGRDSSRVAVLDATFNPSDGLKERLDQLCQEAKAAVERGAVILLLDDGKAFAKGRAYIDPGLATAYLVKFLIAQRLRRRCSVVVRSGAIRNLHDVMFCLGLGADALNPYLLWQMACEYADDKCPPTKALANTFSVLQKGMEKVMSTMGIHELCGYGRIFASVGLKKELEEVFEVPNFCSSTKTGVGFDTLEELAERRLERAESKEELPIWSDPKRNVKVGKILRAVAVGDKGFKELANGLGAIDEEMPIGLRHLLSFKYAPEEKRLTMDDVDVSIGHHDYPIVIAAMSFGSQGENSFRAYAEAAARANIICMNGEGGEIPDMLFKYNKNRGQQIASGRFGVYMAHLNSGDYLEIKIGQGAKPGEGGHLPGQKVSEMVAKARHCRVGTTLISPSNHHDIYSIEDLAQIITELKTANPHAKVSVKIPVTSGVGTIAVGIAKAGADIVNLSGFEGGTGAAREHAKKYVGLPIEVGVSEAHRALVEAGLRDAVEIWADGGLRSGADVVKMVLLGADRVGMGTVALMGVGCISCHRCHLDRCPRGISTQLRTKKDAEERGVKGFTPRQMETEAENLARLIRAIGDEMRWILAEMGVKRITDVVGRTDLLEQTRFLDRVDLAGILAPPAYEGLGAEKGSVQRVKRPLNHLTRLISDMAMARFERGAETVCFFDEGVRSTDRAVGTYLAGEMVRVFGIDDEIHRAKIRLESSVPGNGLCAFTIPGIETVVDGGSQDGAAKGSYGGLLCVLKGRNMIGRRVDGSTGKSFAYGAIGGTLIVQNYADSRACIRMSGADVVFGARITEPVHDERGNIASRAHLKGFAFEYMTGGRAVVLGDPGPWMCAGMTGGVVYQAIYPEYNFDRRAIERRLAHGANVVIRSMDEQGVKDVQELLSIYIEQLRDNFQDEEADAVAALMAQAKERFLRIVPKVDRSPAS